MALVSLGKNAALVEHLAPNRLDFTDENGKALAAEDIGPADAQRAATEKLNKTKGDIQKSLTPWIPGDFLLTYGTLLTAWDSMQGSFCWLLILGISIPVVFVWAGAFSLNGFKDWSSSLATKLVGHTVLGILVSMVVAATVPGSGWYAFAWFRTHEQSVLTTLGVATGALVLLLTGLKMRGVVSTDQVDTD